NQAFIKKTSLGDAVMVPLRYERTLAAKDQKATGSPLKTQSYLMIYRDNNRQYHTEVVTRIPDENYWNHRNDQGVVFTGTVLIEDWQGNAIKSYLYRKESDGVKVYVSKPVQKGDVKVNGNISLWVCNCTDWYQDFGNGWEFVDTTCSCFEQYPFGVGGGGSGGGGTVPGDYDPTHGGGGSGGGDNGVVENYDTPANMMKASKFLSEIDDSQLSPCMKAILVDVKNLSKGSVAGIIKKFSGTMPGYNWTMKNGVLPANTNAETSPLYNNATGTVTTVFDSQKFTAASDLAVARTILHESVHAYLVTFFKTNKPGFIGTYTQMVQEWGIYNNWNDTHHAEMVRTFVKEIATSLEEYGTNKGYNFSTQFYKDLAWGGLTHTGQLDSNNQPIETQWFKSSVPNINDRQRIKNIISIEQSGIDANGNSQNKKGNNSGC
ncbi:MAG: hypothetical protein WBP45_06780, partial [Daejeonella sp.]